MTTDRKADLQETDLTLSNILRSINESMASFGFPEKLCVSRDVPVTLTLEGGRQIQSVITVIVDEDGVTIPDTEKQAKRLAELAAAASPSP